MVDIDSRDEDYLLRVIFISTAFLYIIYLFTQPLHSSRKWHKVNSFKQSLTGLNSEFSFS